MRVLKLSASELRQRGRTLEVLLTVETLRKNGRATMFYTSIVGEDDIPAALQWLAQKFDVGRFEYQPNLLFTWEWEPAIENAMLEFNLTRAQ